MVSRGGLASLTPSGDRSPGQHPDPPTLPITAFHSLSLLCDNLDKCCMKITK